MIHPERLVADQVMVLIADSEEAWVGLGPALSRAVWRDNDNGMLRMHEHKLLIR